MEHSILTKRQIAFLECLGAETDLVQSFYLTGGTTLAAFYLYHRYSEDLDFFFEEEVDLLKINVFLKKYKNKLGIKTIDIEQSYNRNLFFLHFDDEIIKTEFTYFPFPRIEKGSSQYGVRLDSIIDIATNKLFTIYQRTRARDYIDLYFLCQEYQYKIQDLIAMARIKFDTHLDPIQLGTQFIKAMESTDMPRMIKNISDEVWQNFFLEEAKKLKPAIFEI